jgi:flagellar basal body-associated protein FliL
MAEEIKEKEAKQGREGKPVLKVLIVGLTLAFIAMGGYLFWVGGETPTEEPTITNETPVTDPTSPANPADVAPEPGVIEPEPETEPETAPN